MSAIKSVRLNGSVVKNVSIALVLFGMFSSVRCCHAMMNRRSLLDEVNSISDVLINGNIVSTDCNLNHVFTIAGFPSGNTFKDGYGIGFSTGSKEAHAPTPFGVYVDPSSAYYYFTDNSDIEPTSSIKTNALRQGNLVTGEIKTIATTVIQYSSK